MFLRKASLIQTLWIALKDMLKWQLGRAVSILEGKNNYCDIMRHWYTSDGWIYAWFRLIVTDYIDPLVSYFGGANYECSTISRLYPSTLANIQAHPSLLLIDYILPLSLLSYVCSKPYAIFFLYFCYLILIPSNYCSTYIMHIMHQMM